MRLFLIAALLLAGGALPALAQENGYSAVPADQPQSGMPESGLPHYVGLRGSLAFAAPVETSVAPATPLAAGYGMGGGGSVYVGTRLPYGFRLELEGQYRTQSLDSATLNGVALSASGRMQTIAPMVNLMWDFPVPNFPVRPFVGAGAGAALTKLSLNSASGVLNSNDWRFAYQIMGGFQMPLNQSSRLTALYRWMRADLDLNCGAGGAATSRCRADRQIQSLDLGFEMDM